MKWRQTVMFGLVVPLAGLSPLSCPAVRADSGRVPVTCAAITLHPTPGIHPPGMFPMTPAPDAPRIPITVNLPLYPGAVPLDPPIGYPYFTVVGSPYLQTAAAEYQSANGGDVAGWYGDTLSSCGWRADGWWAGNAGTFPQGDTFESATNPNLELQAGIHYAYGTGNEIDFTLAVEDVVYPAPPPRARVHGPFVQLRIASLRYVTIGNNTVKRVVHAAVRNRSVIRRLVYAINHLSDYFTVPTVCAGGPAFRSGTWFTLMRADGTKVHGFDAGPGPCNHLAVNHVRWLLDPGTVWKQLQRLVTKRR